MSANQSNHMSDHNYSSLGAIKLVAAREFGTFIKNKSVLVTFVILVLAVIAGLGVTSWVSNMDGSDEPDKIAVVKEEPAFLKPITAQAGQEGAPNYAADVVGSAEEAKQKVTDGDVAAALVAADQPNSWRLIAKSPQWEMNALLQGALNSWAEANALDQLGVNPQQVADLKGNPTITGENLDEEEESPESFMPVIVSLIGVAMMMMAIMTFAASVGTSVTEEKSSRVVEIMLATVRPFDLLAGKLIGIGAVGLAQMAVLLLIGAVGLQSLKFGFSFDIDPMIWVYLILFFVLGYFFFAALYAAAGATVSRSEDLSSAQMPVMILAMATIYVPAFGWSELQSTFMQVAGWIPPLSAAVAPIQFASGNYGHLQMLGAAALLALATVGVNWISARIYRATIMLTGARVTWAKAIKLAR